MVEACIKNNRRFIAFELNPTYYEIILRRAEKAKTDISNMFNFGDSSNSASVVYSEHINTQTQLFEKGPANILHQLPVQRQDRQ